LSASKTKRKNDTVFILFSLVCGLLMGWLAADFSGSGLIGAIFRNFGIWIMAGALLGRFSENGSRAILHDLILYFGAIASSTVHILIFGGNISSELMIRLVILSAIGGLIGFFDWHSKEKGWKGGICAAVPISLLLMEGYPIIHSASMVLGFDILCAIILFIILPHGMGRKLYAIPSMMVFLFALVYFDVYSKLIGGFI